MFNGNEGFNLGDAHGRIVLDGSSIDQNVQTAQRSFDGMLRTLGTQIDQIGRSFQRAGVQVTALTAPIAIFAVDGVQNAAAFERSMAEIGVRAGLTADELERVSQFALQLGSETAFSAQEAADAFLQLLTSGQNAEEAISTLPAVLDAAAASGEDLGRTADTVTDIMAMFNLGVDEAQGIVDALAQAAGASSASMGDLGQSFANVGGTAAQYGLTYQETAAIFAIFAENGIKGAEAGTQLRSMLNNMGRDVDEVNEIWQELGTSLYDAEGQIRPLNDLFAELSVIMAEMPDEQRNQTIQTLAGTYGQLGFTALLSSISIDEMTGRMNEAADASDVAQARLDGMAGAAEELSGSVETLQIEALTPFMQETIEPLIDDITEIVNGITAWVQENPVLTQQILQLAAPLLVAGPALLALGTVMTLMGPIVTGLAAVVGLLVSPIGLLIGAIVALGVILSNEDIQGGLRALGEGLSSAWMVIQILFDRIKRGIEVWFLDLQLGFGEWLEDLRQRILNLTGGNIDIAPQIQLSMDNLQLDRENLQVADAIERVISEQLQAGQLDLSGITLNMETAASSISTSLDAALRQPEWVQSISFTGRQRIQDALQLAFSSGDTTAIEVLLPVATQLQIDVQSLVLQIAASIRQAEGEAAARGWLEEVAVPVLTEMQIPTDQLVQQFEQAVTQAADAQTYSATPTAAPELQFDLLGVVQQMATMVEQAAQMQVYQANASANVTVSASSVDVSPLNNSVTSTIAGVIGSIAGYVRNAVSNVRSQVQSQMSFGTLRDSGGPGLPGELYLIGDGAQPEAFIPDRPGTFVPNFDRVMAGMGGGGDNYTINVQMPERALASPEAARTAGEEFGNAILERMRTRG